MNSMFRVAAYTAMTVIGLMGLKSEGVIDLDTKKLLDLFK